MGIRFEYGARKATNGPMIFFSDPVAEVNLQEEIRGAIGSRLCFYAYRMPGDMMVSFGSSEGYVDGIGVPGFVIAPFLPDQLPITIPYAPSRRIETGETYPFPTGSTSREEYCAEVEAIRRFIDGDGAKKVVAARVKVENDSADVASTFLNLTRAYPDAYVFCFSTPKTGCWIGATPELLLHRHGALYHTMALAGTRPADNQLPWDEKNIREQEMVTRYILRALREAGLQPEALPTVSRRAGRIEHLCTPIEASGNAPSAQLLARLSPTPATAGVPRQEALSLIAEYENFHRAYYGGYCGPFRSENDFDLCVILRCARVEAERYALFAGGGITSASVADNEWEETEMKLSTLGRHLEF